MVIEKFGEQFRLRTKRDECGDKIIPGKRGHLYFTGSELCLMAIDGPAVHRRQWEALGGKLWMGDVSPNAKGRRVQDVRILGIPLQNARSAIKMIRARPKRVLSAEEREALLMRLHK